MVSALQAWHFSANSTPYYERIAIPGECSREKVLANGDLRVLVCMDQRTVHVIKGSQVKKTLKNVTKSNFMQYYIS